MARGGRGRGRGGAARLLAQRGDGTEIPKFVVRHKPVTFPPTPTPVTPPATLRERAVVAKYREFRDKMRNGPYYAVLGRTSRISKPSPFSTLRKGNGAAIVGGISGFSSVHTYTGRYQKHDKTLPVLADVKWMKNFIPEELWSVVDPDLKKEELLARRKRMRQSTFHIGRLGEDGEEEDIEGEEEEDPIDIEQDEDWEDAEDEELDYEEREKGYEELEKDDYNAEQYFDNGEDDEGGGDDEPAGGDYE